MRYTIFGRDSMPMAAHAALFIPAVILLIGLPLAGAYLTGGPVHTYLEFPPVTRHVAHAPFSLPVFLGMALFIIVFICPFLLRIVRAPDMPRSKKAPLRPFPWWGYVGMVLCALAWIMAWTRFPWFEAFQLHTFTPLWLSYIIVMNALTWRRSGRCPMLNRTKRFMALFPLSAVFWWFFEFLNRFVQNWYYVAVEQFSPIEYFWFASLSFSTVLPAVLSTCEFFMTYPVFNRAFGNWTALNVAHPKRLASFAFLLACLGLTGLAALPDLLYPLVWIAPLIIIVSLQALLGRTHVFSPLTAGNWGHPVCAALAALLCGFFWELWNYHSLAKWIYSVPYVHRISVFEMPLLGFAGYLPFGLECVVIGTMVYRQNHT